MWKGREDPVYAVPFLYLRVRVEGKTGRHRLVFKLTEEGKAQHREKLRIKANAQARINGKLVRQSPGTKKQEAVKPRLGRKIAQWADLLI